MEVKLQKWGNSSGIRIPANLIKELGFKLDETLKIVIVNNKLIISKPKHKTFNERISNYKKINNPEEFDFGKQEGKEIW